MSEEEWAVEEERLRAGRARRARARTVTVLTTLIRTAGGGAALVLVAYIVITIGGANPQNGIARFVSGWADTLALGFRDLFTPADARLRVIVNYGLAALFWLAVAGVLNGILRRLSSPYEIS